MRRRRNPAQAVAPSIEQARAAFRDFHEAEPVRMQKVHIPDPPKAGWQLGKLIEIVYEPQNPSKRARTQYSHEFGDFGNPILSARFGKRKPLLIVSADGNQLLIVRGPSKFHVTERGIVG